MEEKEIKEGKSQKMTYEQLEAVAHQLSEQNRELYAKLQQLDMINIFKRLDYLFKIVENQTKFNKKFVDKSKEEIEALMTIPEKEQGDAKEETEFK